ncbi:PAS modulated sigma54 specific transcriptional regulator, Fis family [Oleidesulfovibrio alaskensis G20]|jgi:PAS domain S-box-containing protein|uniref:PAS modulated sigma54 specific transcriptional regulator, Fis family n=1 Tax=Oleidesulfovibrio alaskensis (strain ATCC BAA-1058 / DSM 17464 / G20) TaxID=207559 RepID=Q312S5_OLEA2|nr:sigma-54-dependent Fis family transcriptional regulator [Oleidesulfovibrio alaskensis]ABB38071.1 PAS modulated sigma54 specific transcriptional regulator, Fis family [Oleidesulfovibrio alaskensis G20]MBG0773951.1 sigma-54-dependent Fis family transcriptional regulator [Oleidesulfovibrio alaskensis]
MRKVIQHIESIFDVLSDGIYITDKSGKTLFVNKRYEQLTGLQMKDIKGLNVSTLLEEGVFDIILNPEIVRTRRPATSVQNVRQSKKVILRGYPVFDDEGEVCLVVTFARDITMITQFRDQIAQQRELIDSFNERMEHMAQEQTRHPRPVFESHAMKRVLELLQRVASTDATMLILGETGVGKDVIARLAHEYSPRDGKLFMKVDCGSIAENLIESELFGYVPGAFSGASSKGKPGYFEIADGGTVFLDEIGELPLPMQAKLLRVLQDREVMRVGATQPKEVNVRIIAATNRNLAKEVEEGRFRSDLFYRLNVAVLRLPPLRERSDDILPLADTFLDRFNAKYHRTMTMTRATRHALGNYGWPGNVREMQNLIQSLVVTCDGRSIRPEHLPPHITRAGKSTPYTPPAPEDERPLKEIMADIEREILQEALKRHGSVCKVASMYKISRTTLFRKLRDVQDGTHEDA